MIKLKLNRYYASGIHLLISSFIVGASAFLVFILWYPGLLAYASGVHNIFLIIIFVDVILGPLITLVVFNIEKKALKLDLFIVGCIQIAALFYGIHTLFEVRPIFVVFNNDRFDIVYVNELTQEELKTSRYDELKILPNWGPKVIGAQLPIDKNKAEDIMLSAVAGGDDVQQMPTYYVPYNVVKKLVTSTAKPLALIRSFNKNQQADVDDLISHFSTKSNKIGYIPLVGKTKKIVVVVDIETAEILLMSKLKPLDDSYGVNSLDWKVLLKKSN